MKYIKSYIVSSKNGVDVNLDNMKGDFTVNIKCVTY
ncbi:hypothetical protein Xszus_02323 [Xenorhabdus szentirmaii]|nr:hypothetical protein Xsze_00230 [Xenorhabdus szentirmaii DSM 16338]PHM42584.1 hypothetical protein Xszus_02323 [Xenorhabdus szentirmaii]